MSDSYPEGKISRESYQVVRLVFAPILGLAIDLHVRTASTLAQFPGLRLPREKSSPPIGSYQRVLSSDPRSLFSSPSTTGADTPPLLDPRVPGPERPSRESSVPRLDATPDGDSTPKEGAVCVRIISDLVFCKFTPNPQLAAFFTTREPSDPLLGAVRCDNLTPPHGAYRFNIKKVGGVRDGRLFRASSKNPLLPYGAGSRHPPLRSI
ncbi:hypothetical protein TNIN_153331 [Trichonephila inaurata madagascariensis]|uniref:Uncharacterized protein n=1 Tax=Trichonephila inaurata madagascariensis TaxID=2747483 RepID=A0A8X7C9V6_9ARAC|nr:hypothetical protein TNIN_153331 [Trichonephila inaurata madagascariensis]